MSSRMIGMLLCSTPHLKYRIYIQLTPNIGLVKLDISSLTRPMLGVSCSGKIVGKGHKISTYQMRETMRLNFIGPFSKMPHSMSL